MLDIILGKLMEWLSSISGGLVRKYYTEERITNAIKIDVSGQNEGLTIDGGEVPRFGCWLYITNHNPFDLELERLFGRLIVGGHVTDFTYLFIEKVKKHDTQQIYVEGFLHDWAANKLVEWDEMKWRPRIEYAAHFESRVRDFWIRHRSIEPSNYRTQNFRKSQ